MWIAPRMNRQALGRAGLADAHALAQDKPKPVRLGQKPAPWHEFQIVACESPDQWGQGPEGAPGSPALHAPDHVLGLAFLHPETEKDAGARHQLREPVEFVQRDVDHD